MIAPILAWGAAAEARPTEATAEQYLEWYAAGEHDRLWEAASERYREQTCLGERERCPDLGRIPLGERQQARMSCGSERRGCTWTRTDRYDAPPLPYSEATELDWIVTTDLEGRFAGVAVAPREPGASARALGRMGGLGCGLATTFALVWALLLALLQIGGRQAVRSGG